MDRHDYKNHLCSASEHHQADYPILIVEDDPILQAVNRDLIERLGYEVEIAENGREAVAACQSKNYLMILMDVHMPIMNGFEATLELRRQHGKRLPIIAFTTDTTRETAQACLEAGMNSVVIKPISLKNLESLIEKIEWLVTQDKLNTM